ERDIGEVNAAGDPRGDRPSRSEVVDVHVHGEIPARHATGLQCRTGCSFAVGPRLVARPRDRRGARCVPGGAVDIATCLLEPPDEHHEQQENDERGRDEDELQRRRAAVVACHGAWNSSTGLVADADTFRWRPGTSMLASPETRTVTVSGDRSAVTDVDRTLCPPTDSTNCSARAVPSSAVAPWARAARAPSCAAACTTCSAWYQRPNWITSMIRRSRTGTRMTVSVTASPRSPRTRRVTARDHRPAVAVRGWGRWGCRSPSASPSG